jgi:hypothetical protein
MKRVEPTYQLPTRLPSLKFVRHLKTPCFAHKTVVCWSFKRGRGKHELFILASNKKKKIDTVHRTNIRIEQNNIWFRALAGPMHLGLKTSPLYPIL